MASKKKNSINFRKYKTKREMNIGILIFAIVLIYLVVTIFMYATDKRISVYEVREGSIVKDNSYTGIILRNETVVTAEAEGYISYYQNESSKIKAGSNVYVLSPSKLDTVEAEGTENTALSSEEQKNLNVKVQNFNENFSSQKFSAVYNLKNEFQTALLDASSLSKQSQIDAIIAQSGSDVTAYQSPKDGVLIRCFDGYETLTEDKLDSSCFDRSNIEIHRIDDQSEIKKDDPVYRLVTSEEWDVYVELDEDMIEKQFDEEMKAQLEEGEAVSVKVRIDKDSETLWSDFSLIKKKKQSYGKLHFENSMIRYADDRFLNIELILEDEQGLKIPKSAVIEKEFYTVPSDYLTASGDSSGQGVMIQKKTSITYQEATVYYRTDDEYVYLNPNDFKKNTVLVKPDSQETLNLKTTKTLKGVYCINKGYAVFKPVSILCENDDYYIVQDGNSYGLSNYDHIVQDGKSVKESEVVFQ